MPKTSNKKKLGATLAPLFKSAGYRKRALTWHRNHDQTILVFNIQKSMWGEKFYINLGVYLTALGVKNAPPEYECHFRTRMEHVIPRPSRLRALLDFSKGIPDSKRLPAIERLVSRYALPWLGKHSSLPRLRSLGKRQGHVLVMGRALTYLGIRL